jgi:hypothetical protein
MFIRKIGMLVVGLALAGKDCGATEAVVLPKDSQFIPLPGNRIKKGSAVKIPFKRKGQSAMARRSSPNPRKRSPDNQQRNQPPPREPEPQKTIDQIIYDITEENGAIYAMDSEKIFDGSGKKALKQELQKSMNEIKSQIKRGKNIENLDGWLEVIDRHICNLEQTTSMAYFELSDYTPEQIENYNQYYRLAKGWFEKLGEIIHDRETRKESV